MPERIQQLSAAMAAGDSEAVEAFYRQYFDFLYRQARRCTRRDESFCLDVVQDATLRIIRTVRAVDTEPRFLGWLKLVVQTTSFDLLRGERRRKNREAMAGVSPVKSEPDSDSLQLDWLSEQISKLDPELVRMIEMRFDQSWSLKRIGQAMGISISAVDGRLRRALRKLELSATEFENGEVIHSEWVQLQPLSNQPDRHGPALPVNEPEPPAPGLPLQQQVEIPAIEPAPTEAILSEPIPVELKSEEPDRHGPALPTNEPEPPAPGLPLQRQVEIPIIEMSPTESIPAGSILVELESEEPDRPGLPMMEIESSPQAAEAAGPVTETDRDCIATPVLIETPRDELIGLEDEAGAYDDRL